VKNWFGLAKSGPGRPPAAKPPPAAAPAGPPSSLPNSGSAASVRKDLLRVVMRETLFRNGIPAHWLAAEILRSLNSKREPGFHLRILVRHWDPRLMLYAVALQRNLQQRLLLLDPNCGEWLVGFSWQFVLPESARCLPLPHPSTWTTPPPPADTEPGAPITRGADLIQGPVQIGGAGPGSPRAQLERLLAARDQDLGRSGSHQGFDPTRPDQL
jgi:hypothetical protein